jgi:hypothetical protein
MLPEGPILPDNPAPATPDTTPRARPAARHQRSHAPQTGTRDPSEKRHSARKSEDVATTMPLPDGCGRPALLGGEVGPALAQHVLLDLAGRGLRQLVTKVTPLGALKSARRARANAIMSSSAALPPSRSSTKACGVSPHFSSGRPTIAISCTAGWRSNAPSTSTEEIFSPPMMITSLSRSRISASRRRVAGSRDKDHIKADIGRYGARRASAATAVATPPPPIT